MRNQNAIGFRVAPFVTIERYAELSGIPINTIKTHIRKGLIPTKKKPISEKSSRTKTLINMVEVTALAQAESKIKVDVILGG